MEAPPQPAEERPSRILFGSCNSQHYAPVLWPAMASRRASALVWAGDAVYADDFAPTLRVWKKGAVRAATPAVLQELYARLLDEPGYRRFTRRGNDSSTTSSEVETSDDNMHVLGVYDDHDYGINNGDKHYQFRTESAMLFVQFLKSSSARPIDLAAMEARAAAGRGVYGVKVFDFGRPAGLELLSDQEAGIEPSAARSDEVTALSDRSVAIFLVDCRSNKSPWKKGFPGKHFPDYDADFLGAEQWEWLQATLPKSRAAVNVIVQGLQVHADRYFDGNLAEDWSRFPMAQHRLYQTILNSGAAAPVLVSGDVHMAELLRKDCRRAAVATPPPRVLLEVTTSGM